MKLRKEETKGRKDRKKEESKEGNRDKDRAKGENFRSDKPFAYCTIVVILVPCIYLSKLIVIEIKCTAFLCQSCFNLGVKKR